MVQARAVLSRALDCGHAMIDQFFSIIKLLTDSNGAFLDYDGVAM